MKIESLSGSELDDLIEAFTERAAWQMILRDAPDFFFEQHLDIKLILALTPQGPNPSIFGISIRRSCSRPGINLQHQ